MRQIEFRGKRLDNPRWMSGYYSGPIHTFPHSHHIVDPNTGSSAVIDPETLCQYTGLNDFAGAKIFEGDILQSNDEKIDVLVYFLKSGFVFRSYYGHIRNLHELWENDPVCIVGNKFDTPELLEGNKCKQHN